MSRIATLFTALTLAFAATACSESSASEKSPEEVRQEAESMDQAQLEEKIQETKDLIAAKTAELEEKGGDAVAKTKEALDKGIDGLMNKGEEVLAENDDLVKELQGQIDALQSHLSVYMDELTKKKGQ